MCSLSVEGLRVSLKAEGKEFLESEVASASATAQEILIEMIQFEERRLEGMPCSSLRALFTLRALV